MDHAIHGLDFAAAYLDDLIMFSELWEEHLIHILMVLEWLHQAGLTAKARSVSSKCVYLDHIVGSGIVQPEEDKTADSFQLLRRRKLYIPFKVSQAITVVL